MSVGTGDDGATRQHLALQKRLSLQYGGGALLIALAAILLDQAWMALLVWAVFALWLYLRLWAARKRTSVNPDPEADIQP